MTKKPNLIFDAGGVLVFPDFDLLAEIANQVNIETIPVKIAEQHANLFRAFDEHVSQYQNFPDIHYFRDIFEKLTASEEKIRAAVDLTHNFDKKKHIWTTTRPWVGESLKILQEQGFHMAVVSNSDGRVDQILQELDLRKYFDIVIDSFVVGIEKPDPRIFNIALENLNWEISESIYIGDIFYIDIWGANQAGLGGVHIDKMDLYNDWDGIRIPSVKELPDLINNVDGNLSEMNLFPVRDFKINI
jgi:putative hydrolase of the HAD superfamily